MNNKGKIFFEINETMGLDMVDMLLSKDFGSIILKEDLSGKDRMIKG